MEDPFATLGLPRRFDLDPGLVQSAFVTRSAQVMARLADQEEGERLLAELSRAKSLIEHPESRADALLSLLGGPARERERSLAPGFLQEIMEVRQDMESQFASVSGADRPALIERWQEWAEHRRAGHEKRVAELFANMATGTNAAQSGQLLAIRRELNAWRYIERMIEQIDPASDGPN